MTGALVNEPMAAATAGETGRAAADHHDAGRAEARSSAAVAGERALGPRQQTAARGRARRRPRRPRRRRRTGHRRRRHWHAGLERGRRHGRGGGEAVGCRRGGSRRPRCSLASALRDRSLTEPARRRSRCARAADAPAPPPWRPGSRPALDEEQGAVQGGGRGEPRRGASAKPAPEATTATGTPGGRRSRLRRRPRWRTDHRRPGARCPRGGA